MSAQADMSPGALPSPAGQLMFRLLDTPSADRLAHRHLMAVRHIVGDGLQRGIRPADFA